MFAGPIVVPVIYVPVSDGGSTDLAWYWTVSILVGVFLFACFLFACFLAWMEWDDSRLGYTRKGKSYASCLWSVLSLRVFKD